MHEIREIAAAIEWQKISSSANVSPLEFLYDLVQGLVSSAAGGTNEEMLRLHGYHVLCAFVWVSRLWRLSV